MTRRFNRRELLTLGGALLAGSAATAARNRYVHSVPQFEVPLSIPPVLQPARSDVNADYYEITQRQERLEIIPGLHTAVWGYEGRFPGPTIKARRGRTTVVRHTNRLAAPTVVHLHGGVTPPESDGFPMDLIMPGDSRTYVYPNDHRACTLWYHGHAMNTTGRNIYMGLAGIYILRDDEEQALGLPDGPYDIPLLIQDRTFGGDGSFVYHTVDHLGAQGATILVNGAPWPRLDVSNRKYRFRLINGSNATPFRLALSTGEPLVQIATDGGLLPAPISSPSIPLAMAERVEIVIDFSRYPVGTKIVLRNLETSGIRGPISNAIMRFDVVRREHDDSLLPNELCALQRIDASAAKCTRTFVFSAKPSYGFVPIVNWRINGKAFDPDHPISSPHFGDVEIWHFKNQRFLGLLSLVHPVHLHLVDFLILERNGRPPLPHESGWKDTVAVNKDDEVRVIAKFDHYRGKYLIHCHNLEHEDHSMMARFDVIEGTSAQGK